MPQTVVAHPARQRLRARTAPPVWLFATSALAAALFLPCQLNAVISAHSSHEFRCSHVPPTPDQVNRVWLDNVEFATSEPTPADIDLSSQVQQQQQIGAAHSLARRHIGHKAASKVVVDKQGGNLTDAASGTIWSLLKDRQQPSAKAASGPSTVETPGRAADGHEARALHGDAGAWDENLVPMKIHVHYDASVYQLEQSKLQSINRTVIPSVVKFFEEVLLIRRDYTIDRFRIARRCPNNTIYYAKDVVGLSRPYCMERCEEFAVCGEMIVPREHLSACSYCNISSRRCSTNYASEGRGVENTQLLLYVSAKQTARCRRDQTIAYAAHCAQDTKTDRPVAGHANLCPSSISTDPRDLKALIATVKHELTHVLGFSVSLFAYYRDSQGNPLTPRDSSPGPIPVDPATGYAKWSERVIKRVVRSNWTTGAGPISKEAHLIVTPTVVREVRRHFNCSSLEGAELEDQGSDGTSMTHWEKRLFENEAMTGTHTQNSVYSRITLAVLQDTGWYVANFSRAEQLEWGKHLGCDFAKKSCKSWIDERRAKRLSIRPFCDRVKGDLLQIACTEDRSSKAVCNMRHYKSALPGKYQNFDALDDTEGRPLGHFGGSVDLADFCPFIQEFTWQVQNVTVRGSRCDQGGNSVENEKNAALEYFGTDSRCFEHGRRWEQRSCVYKRHWHHFGAGCYRYSCAADRVNIHVGNKSYPCFYADQLVHVEQLVDHWLYNGSLVCPACDKVCPSSKCVVHDKRLIDQILELSEHSIPSDSRDLMLNAILDEYYNGIDTTGLVDMKNTFDRYKSILDEVTERTASQARTAKPGGLPHLFNLYIFNLYPLKEQYRAGRDLICSGASSRQICVSQSSINVAFVLLAHLLRVLQFQRARE